MKILVCGDRHWKNSSLIEETLKKHLPIDEIIHGACSGADSIAGKIARSLNIPVKEFPANWELYGKGAGPIRNSQMLEQKPDLVIAFHNDIEHSKGTKDMVKKAVTNNIRCDIIKER